NVGVTKVEFYLDGALQATDTTSPYAWSWDTTKSANGSHTLTSKAYDAAANSSSSAAVGVTVSNVADTTPPSAPSNLAASGARKKISLTWSASTDNVGVTSYQVLRSSSATGTFTQIATTTTTSYSDNVASRSTWYYEVTASDAAGNVSAASNVASATAK